MFSCTRGPNGQGGEKKEWFGSDLKPQGRRKLQRRPPTLRQEVGQRPIRGHKHACKGRLLRGTGGGASAVSHSGRGREGARGLPLFSLTRFPTSPRAAHSQSRRLPVPLRAGQPVCFPSDPNPEHSPHPAPNASGQGSAQRPNPPSPSDCRFTYAPSEYAPAHYWNASSAGCWRRSAESGAPPCLRDNSGSCRGGRACVARS